ncbi:MAG: hypothetical protein ACHQ49_06985 [Elusimicrobiota bacterium]
MKKTLLALLLSFAAAAARADMILGNDPLSRQILSSTSQENGGVTAAVRVGTGQSVELKTVDAAAPAPSWLPPLPIRPNP